MEKTEKTFFGTRFVITVNNLSLLHKIIDILQLLSTNNELKNCKLTTFSPSMLSPNNMGLVYK